MREGPLLLLLACGPGPTTTESATPPAPSSRISATREIPNAPDCSSKAMEKLSATIMSAGIQSDLDASAAVQEEVNPPDGTAALSKLSPKLTACNPAQVEGCAYLTTSVERDGTVSGVEPFVSDALPPEVVACLVGVLKEARFEPLPKAGKMQVPVTFTRNR